MPSQRSYRATSRCRLAVLASLCLLNACAASPEPTTPPVPTAATSEGTTFTGSGAAAAPQAESAAIADFIAMMAEHHGFESSTLAALLAETKVRDDILKAMMNPAEAKPWYRYRELFVTPARSDGGVVFWRAHRAALQRAEREYGVPASIIVAIVGVETRYGGYTGKHRVLDALTTLAFHYPRRAAFFRRELEQFLLLARAEGWDSRTPKGSYAGAMGIAQFMPSSYRHYSIDFDSDGEHDLWNPEDAIGSVANYLHHHGWKADGLIAVPARRTGGTPGAFAQQPVKPMHTLAELADLGVTPTQSVAYNPRAVILELDGEGGPEYWLGFDNFYAITRYNTSRLYALAVFQLSEAIRAQLRD